MRAPPPPRAVIRFFAYYRFPGSTRGLSFTERLDVRVNTKVLQSKDSVVRKESSPVSPKKSSEYPENDASKYL